MSWGGFHHGVKSNIVPVQMQPDRATAQIWQTELRQHDMGTIVSHVGLVQKMIAKVGCLHPEEWCVKFNLKGYILQTHTSNEQEGRLAFGPNLVSSYWKR